MDKAVSKRIDLIEFINVAPIPRGGLRNGFDHSGQFE